MRGKGLEVGADLVRHVAVRGRAIAPHEAQIDFTSLHEVSARVVGDERVRNAVCPELERRERGALIAWARLVDEHVHGHAVIVGRVHRRERRAPVDAGEPAGIAMREHIDGSGGIASRELADDRGAVLTDETTALDVLVGNRGRLPIGERRTLARRRGSSAHRPCAPAPIAG